MKKKVALLISVLMVCFSLTACGKSLKGKEFFCDIGESERYTLEFTEDTVTVEHLYYSDNSSSPTGKYLDSSKTTTETYDYETVESGVIECDGKEYSFEEKEIVHLTSLTTSEKYDGLVFDSNFLGLSDEWRISD